MVEWLKKKSEILNEQFNRTKTDKLREIDRELEAIDKASIRSLRGIERARGKGVNPPKKDQDHLSHLEDAVESLRNQRKQIKKAARLEDIPEEIDWPDCSRQDRFK